MEETRKYFAFISYNRNDTKWGKRLQRKLERYKMPATLCSERGWKRRPMDPVFFAPTEIKPGGLDDELQNRLRRSQNLIVICSPNSAQSEWVGKEIEYFHELGTTDKIHFFIVDGVPHSGNPDTECFNPVVEKLNLPEILGANIHEKVYRWSWLNKERAYVQLISKLLGVEYDSIWQRHKRALRQKITAWAVGAICVLGVLFGVWKNNQPADIRVSLKEMSVHNDQLPPMESGIVSLTLDNETKTDTLQTMDGALVFANVPHRFLGKQVRMTFSAPNFEQVDTTLTLSKDVVIGIRRDPHVFGNLHFGIWNTATESRMAGIHLEVDGQQLTTDADGKVSLFVPLERQRTSYPIKSSVPLEQTEVIAPVGEDDYYVVK